MSVFTPVTRRSLEPFLAGYDVGPLVNFHGISEGVENTNYFVDTRDGQFVLTLFERLDYEQLPYFLGLMDHLNQHGVPTPAPRRTRDGALSQPLLGKPAALVDRIPGIGVADASAQQCAAVGQALARLHTDGQGFDGHRPPDRSTDWWQTTARALHSHLAADERELLDDELAFQASVNRSALPTGVIHADLFPDNAFFVRHKLSAIIDFSFARNDLLAYDPAICLNARCFEADSAFNVTKSRALTTAYNAVRPLEPAEIEALPVLCRGASLRFLLTRLHDWLRVPEGALVTPKDPRAYLERLRFHRGVRRASEYGLAL